MLVLVAEGSSVARRRLFNALRAEGHRVLEAGGAGQALTLCRERRPDVLVAATALCERDQLDLLVAVKADIDVFRTAVVPIMPADVSLATVRERLRQGAHDVLLEPVRDLELIARVQAAGRTKILQEELVDQTARLEEQLFEDPLTRVHNRRYVFGQLDAMISGARRHGRPLAVAMVDLDGFKAVNDRHGHDAGDAVLVAAAEALQRALRAEDLLGRLGGEEFLAVLPDTAAGPAAVAAERLRKAVADAGGAGGLPSVTASVGWAALLPGEGPDDLVRRADDALYAAKQEGRDRVKGAATLPRRT
jgi:two-component system cell cycle response regulator